ncbi:MAG TPA: hypothetical protein PK695_11305 [Chitinophagaceae bacterium]|jgi:hypothetical protein|nr:hypothetical protein [Chitinophagaceae bacterium]HMW67068.1 hypothetical protein [Chitinophagaceae bacterium]HMX77306.1 hypothetical protein [Chitinophagaceae bacterium]HNA19101.1 hypothetical protein [Chitinophagaceae bacterium]HNA90630.1 hypothetical protein [Chitinophagaceae bacterium]
MKQFGIFAGFIVVALIASFILPRAENEPTPKPEKCLTSCKPQVDEHENGQELIQNPLYRQFL